MRAERLHLLPGAFLVLLALALRLWDLGARPPHFDEGVNGWFVDQMTSTGYYDYDPTNYHGPLHFHVLWIMQSAFGRSIEVLRLPTAVLGAGCVWLVLSLGRWLGRRAALWAGLLMAVSPAAVYYSRYAIHETWQVFFLLAFVRGWFLRAGYAAHPGVAPGERSLSGPAWMIVAVAGMWATKETHLIHLGAFLLTLPALALWRRVVAPFGGSVPDPAPACDWRGLAPTLFWSLTALLFLFTGGFLHPSDLGDFAAAFAPWIATGLEGGETGGHSKPWPYWLSLKARYEWPALLGLVFAPFCLGRVTPATRFLAVWGCGTLLAYSLIPYKTPWCIVSLLWPFHLLAGVVLASVRRVWPGVGAWLGSLVGLGFAVLSARAALRVSLDRCTDESEPYVYVQTLSDVHSIVGPLLELSRLDPTARQLEGHIVIESSYPLPWMLGDFPNLGYYSGELTAADASVDFLLVGESQRAAVESRLNRGYYTRAVRLRPALESATAYFAADRFAPLFPGEVPAFQPTATNP